MTVVYILANSCWCNLLTCFKTVDMSKLKLEMEELQKQEDEWKQKEEELKKKEKVC